MYSIYALKDPRDNSIRYVGLTKDVHRRLIEHRGCLKHLERPKNQWIQQLRSESIKPSIVVLETDIEIFYEAKKREDYWINFHKSDVLTNLFIPSTLSNEEAIQQYQSTVMNEETVASLLRERGWTFTLRYRRTQGKQYVYAKKRQGKIVIERYIAPLQDIGTLTCDQVIQKLVLPLPKIAMAVEPHLQKFGPTA